MKQKHQRQRIWLTAVMPDLKYLIRTLGLVQSQQGQLHTNPPGIPRTTKNDKLIGLC